jgi:predicted DNA binding CopG/RHH family protein
MKSTTNQDPFKKLVLDDYEQEIERELEAGHYVRAENFQENKKLLEEAAARHLELQKSKSVTLRLNQKDLIRIKAKAKREGIPYQTLISLLIHHYAEGKTTLKL